MPAASSTVTFTVPTMSCEHCKATITNAVQALSDVGDIDIDLDAKTVAVTGGDPAAISAAIVDAGYPIP